MAIKVNIGTARVKLNRFVGETEEKMITILQFVGEEFVRDARKMKRSDGGFGDVTGNLRGSIGYFILKDGQIIQENLRGKAQGKNEAKKALESLPKRTGLQLIGIAGMNYASLVEARGLNVISIQKEAALINLKDLMKDVTQ